MADSVGKITLDLEIVSDITKQVSGISKMIGKNLKSNLDNTTKSTFDNINKSLKGNLEKSNNSIKSMLNKMKNSSKSTIESVMKNLSNIKFPSIKFPKVNSNIPKAVDTKQSLGSRGPPIINKAELRAQIDNTAKELDITNAKIEQQKDKLEQLKLAYSRTFNEARKNKLEEQILKTEGAINKLIGTSDKLGFKLAALDDKFASLGRGGNKSSSSMNNLSQKTKAFTRNAEKTIETSKKLKSNMKNVDSGTKSTGNIFRNSQSQIGMFFGSLFKWGLVFPLIIRGITAMGRSLMNTLNTNSQFASSLAQIKSNLMIAFTPIYQAILPAINALMSALAKATTYIASFISAIFGKTYNQSAQATQGLIDAKAAMGAYGDTAKKTGKDVKDALGLANFDEINSLSKNDSGDSGAGGSGVPELVAPPIDVSTVDSAMQELANKVKSIFRSILQPFKEAWSKEGVATINAIKYAFNELWGLIKSIGKSFLEVWTNGTGTEMVTLVLKILQTILGTIGDIANLFMVAWNSGGIGTKVVQGVANTVNNLLTLILKIGESLRRVLGEVGPGVANTFMKVLDATSGVLENLSSKLIYVWDNGGSHLFEGFIRLGAKIIELAGYIYTEFVAPMVNWFVDTMAPAIAKVADILGNVLDAFTKLINWLLGSGKPVLDAIVITVGAFFAAWEVAKLMSFIQQAGGVVSALSNLGRALSACTLAKIADKLQTIQLTLMYAKDFIVSIANGTLALIKQAAQFAINTGLKLANAAAQGAMTIATLAWNAVCVIATAVTTALGVAIAFLTSPIGLVILAIAAVIAIGVLLYKHWDEVKAKAIEIWNAIKAKFQEFDDWLSNIFKKDWTENFTILGDLLNAFFKSVEQIWRGIKGIFSGIIDFIAGIFTGNWERAWEGVKSIFKGIWDTFAGIAKTPINMIIGLINTMIRAINTAIRGINTLKWDVPDWVPLIGGQRWGFNIPELGSVPYLAKGGILDSPTLAMVGEAGKEAVVPLENNTGGLDLLANKLLERMPQGGNSNNSGNGDLTVQLVISDTKLGEVMIRSFRKLERRTGKAIFNL